MSPHFPIVQNLIVDHGGVDPDCITLEARLEEDLGLDSLDCVHLLMAIEKEYSITLAGDHIFAWRQVSDIIRTLDDLVPLPTEN